MINTQPALGDLNSGLGCFPCGHRAYPRCPHSRLLRRRRIRSSTGRRNLSVAEHPIGGSTSPPASAETYLRVVSGGTSYSQPRLDFHPYAQLIRTICTSVSVQSSTLVSQSFNLVRYRSTGFGSPANDSGRTHPVPRPCGLRTFGFPAAQRMIPLNLAIDQNSLARFSTRTA